MEISPVEIVLLLGLIYLIYKVNKLERMIEGGAKRKLIRTSGGGDGKVIPILKEQIEPGPFKPDRK